jgi:RHH-type rel operon transcriptional repressor/antitoxin RelB
MLGIRLDPELEARLEALAKQTGRTKSECAREAIRRFLMEQDLVEEARKQSLLVSADNHDENYLEFDQRGWKD